MMKRPLNFDSRDEIFSHPSLKYSWVRVAAQF
jgi:hypothetical protein